jgi:hypothetical protein
MLGTRQPEEGSLQQSLIWRAALHRDASLGVSQSGHSSHNHQALHTKLHPCLDEYSVQCETLFEESHLQAYWRSYWLTFGNHSVFLHTIRLITYLTQFLYIWRVSFVQD